MEKIIIALLILTSFMSSKAKNTFYNHINLGEYSIGYCDSIIYDYEIQYQEYDYKGPAPIFTKIWFPLARANNRNYLKFADFNAENIPNDLLKVYRELSKQMDTMFINYGIAFNIVTGEKIDYGSLSTQEVLDEIKLIETISSASKIHTTLNYPIIVYHHGSQGLSYENSIMGEYFASKGYIFISANFHLPFPNTVYGLLPFSLENEEMHKQSTASAVIRFAKTLSNSNSLTFIGHSWGAQEGWCFLHDSSHVSAFISLETTIEYQSDSTKIRDMWPYVYDAVKIKKNRFSIPILLFAAVDDNMSFDFFKNLSSKEMVFASYKQPFTHNSYTSFFMMRYFLNQALKQPDSDFLLAQIQAYACHLNFMAAFLENKKKGSKANLEGFNDKFIITYD